MKRPKTLRTILPVIFNNLRQGATFMSIKGYTDNFGGTSNFGIVFHVSYINAVKKSLNIWQAYTPRNELECKVRKELLDSYLDTLSGSNFRARSAHAYRPISDGKSLIRSVKWHDNGKACHFWGFGVHKIELKHAIYPFDMRNESTIVRRYFLNMTPLHRFRQFKIVEGRFNSIGIDNLTLTQKDLLRDL